jgi:hypothetical protein
VTLDLSVQGGDDSAAEFTVSWTDAGGHAQTINLGVFDSQGVSTSLPSGGTISWSFSSTPRAIVAGRDPGVANGFGWQVERVVR